MAKLLQKALQTIQRAQRKILLILHHMEVDHRRLDAGMPEEFLNGADIRAILQQMRRVTVALRASLRDTL